MTLTKIVLPDAVLFRFDPDKTTPTVRGIAYYERTIIQENGVTIQSTEGNAQPVSNAAGVPGLDLTAIMGIITTATADTLDRQTKDAEAASQFAQPQASYIEALNGHIESAKVDADKAAADAAATIAALTAEAAAKDANIQTLLAQVAALTVPDVAPVVPVAPVAP